MVSFSRTGYKWCNDTLNSRFKTYFEKRMSTPNTTTLTILVPDQYFFWYLRFYSCFIHWCDIKQHNRKHRRPLQRHDLTACFQMDFHLNNSNNSNDRDRTLSLSEHHLTVLYLLLWEKTKLTLHVKDRFHKMSAHSVVFNSFLVQISLKTPAFLMTFFQPRVIKSKVNTLVKAWFPYLRPCHTMMI